MLVYRICDKSEVEHIIDTKSFNQVGGLKGSFGKNSHLYQLDDYYMHFFLHKLDVYYRMPYIGRCICTYDVPEDILNKGLGFGVYIDKNDFRKRARVLEYSIKSIDMSTSYLKKVEVLIQNLFLENIEDGEINAKFTETIYEDKTLIRERKKEESSS